MTTYEVDSASGCWNWTGLTTPGGYGTLRVDGRKVYAHRHFYETHVGPIPDGLQIDHLCRNRACCNPAHLEPVTCAENVRRGWEAGRKSARGRVLTLDERAEALSMAGPARVVADHFGVSPATIRRLRRAAGVAGHKGQKLTWSDVRAIRADAGSTQQALADRFGVSDGLICRIKHGKVWWPDPLEESAA